MSVTRQLIFSTGIDDEVSVSGFYSFAEIADGNGSSTFFSCAYMPPQKAGAISMGQNVVFLGTHNSSLMYQAFNENKTRDGETLITASLISNQIAPTLGDEEPLEMVRFISLEAGNINSLSRGVMVQYLIDKENPHLSGYIWNDAYYDTGSNRVFFEEGIGRWINIKITDETEVVSRDAWSSFGISYYKLGTRPEEAGS